MRRDAPGRPRNAEPGKAVGQVASKSVARRLALYGRPPPACTCGVADVATLLLDKPERADDHAMGCVRGAYLAMLAITRT